MNSILSPLSEGIYNRFSQCPAVQMIVLGAKCIGEGKRLICHQDPNSSLIKKIGRVAAGTALIAGGLTAEWYYFKDKLLECPCGLLELASQGIDASCKQQIDLYKLMQLPHQSRENPQNGLLYLIADPSVDHNCATTQIKRVINSFNSINKLTLGEQVRIIQRPIDICHAIHTISSLYGPISDLAISGHGTADTIDLSSQSAFQVFDPLPTNCFNGLSSTARIILKSCSTGRKLLLRPNFAQWLSWISGREVIAATDSINDLDARLVDGKMEVTLGTLRETVWDSTGWHKFLNDLTVHYNTSAFLSEKAAFFMNLVVPTLLGTMVTWQSARIGASILQKCGSIIERMVDSSSGPLKNLALKTGLYRPRIAQILYTTAKAPGQILNTTGSLIKHDLDVVSQAAGNAGSWILQKGITATKTATQKLYHLCHRNRS